MIIEDKKQKTVKPLSPGELVIPQSNFVPAANILDDGSILKTLPSIPTDPPQSGSDFFRIYNGSLYFYDKSNGTWNVIGGGGTAIAGRMVNTAGQNINTSTETQVTFNTADVEEGITCNLTNDQFEILTEGTYLVTAQVSYTDPVSGKIIQAIIEDDAGTYLSQSQWVTSSTDMVSVNVTFLGDFSVGDKVRLYTFHNCGGTETIQAETNTFFQINKV